MIVIDGRALLIIAAIMVLMIYEKCKFDIWNNRRKEERNEESYFIDSTHDFRIGLIFGLCNDADMAGL